MKDHIFLYAVFERVVADLSQEVSEFITQERFRSKRRDIYCSLILRNTLT